MHPQLQYFPCSMDRLKRTWLTHQCSHELLFQRVLSCRTHHNATYNLAPESDEHLFIAVLKLYSYMHANSHANIPCCDKYGA